MTDFNLGLAGSVTIAALVVLGIFVYPWLLRRRGGWVIVAAVTAALAGLFFSFDRSRGMPTEVAALLGTLWALAPLLAALIVRRFRLDTPSS